MSERPVRSRTSGPEAFEARLFAMIEAGEVHFPKALLSPVRQPARAAGLVRALRELAGWLVRPAPPYLRPAAAAAAALALALPAYRGLHPLSPPAGAAQPRIAAAPMLELGQGPVRSEHAAARSRLVLGAADDLVVLSFLLPAAGGPGAAYQATLTDAAGRLVARKVDLRVSDDGLFVLVCSRALLGEGRYLLTVSPAGPHAQARAPEAQFPFEIAAAGAAPPR